MKEEYVALFITLLVGIFIIIGAVIALLVKKKEKFIDFAMALAFAVIIMLLFTDLMPEVSDLFGVKYIYLFIIFVLLGVFGLNFLDKFIPDHEDTKMTKKDEKNNLVHIGIVATVALVIHNIIEGMAIYSTAMSSINTGLLVALGVGCHNIPLGMLIATTLNKNSVDKKRNILIVVLLFLSTFAGGLIVFSGGNLINDIFLGILLSITIGMLIYICSNEIFPRLKKSKNRYSVISGIVVGILLIALSSLL